MPPIFPLSETAAVQRLRKILLPQHRFQAWLRPGRGTYLVGALLVLLLAMGVSLLVYATGGTQGVFVHLGYLPVLVAGLVFEVAGGVVVGAVMGLLLGPYMPFDVGAAVGQETLTWLVRVGFFVLFGVVVGAIFAWLRRQWLILENAAYTDALTGLPNSRYFKERAEAVAGPGHTSFLYVVSVNSLSQVTASFGFQAMEEVLRQVAARLQAMEMEDCSIFRIHMGQFGVWAPGELDLMPQLMEAAGAPVQVEGTPLYQDISIFRSAIFNDVTIGVTRLQSEEQVDWAIRRASGAAQWASESGQRMAEFHAEQEEDRRSRLLLLGELPQAMAEGQLIPYFHPKIDLASGEIVGCEALVRWHHPQEGIIPPGRFIPYVEQSPLMGEVTLYMMHAVCGYVREWRAKGLAVPVAVNASVHDLASEDTVSELIRIITEQGDPDCIELEVTEGVSLEGGKSLESLHRLREAGIRLAIDDYGTGYSSLAHLKAFPATSLKVDKSFVQNLTTDGSDQSLVASTIRLGHELGMAIIAEGVEDAQVDEELRTLGCDQAQGFYYTRPLPPEETEAFVRNWTPVAAFAGLPNEGSRSGG